MSTSPTANDLQQRFGKSGSVRFFSGKGGLTAVELTAPTGSAQIYLQGAHVTAYQPKGQQPVIWMSDHSFFEHDKSIRGGVPVILPWFGKKKDDPKAPQHGFVRTVEWNFDSVQQRGSDVGVTLSVRSGAEARQWWPQDFEARFSVMLGSSLEMSLQMRNASTQAFEFEEALHTYFAVADIRKVKVDGLSGVTYADKVRDFKRFKQEGPVTFTGETDRLYLNTTSACIIDDPGLRRRIIVDKANSASTVVWNPWSDKAKAIADFGADAWTGMVCVETCNAADNAIKLPAGKTHEMKAILRSEPF